MKARIRYSDGCYSLIADENGPVELSDFDWKLYQKHIEADVLWHRRLCEIDNKILEEQERSER